MLCNKKLKFNRKEINKSLLLLSIILFFVLNISFVYFATANTYTTEESKKPKGHKIENAEYFEYDPNSDKYRIIIAEGEGGSGEGGGSSGGGNNAISGQGTINGNANGGSGGTSGAGTSKNAGTNGIGAGNSINNTGNQSSNKNAEAIRKSIDESRRESIANMLETAANRQIIEQSIAEQESIYESIQKKIRQESINARINAERYNIPSPTVNVVIETLPPQTVPTMRTTHYDSPVATTENIAPVENTISPLSVQFINETTLKTFDMPIVETKPTEVAETTGPGDNIVEESKDETTVEETIQNTIENTQTEKETEVGGGNKKETATIAEGNENDFGSNILGKENAENDTNELQDGNLNGFGYSESTGDYKNVKILEIDRNGGLGFTNVGKSKSIINKLLLLILFGLMIIGTIKYTLPYIIKTKNKKSYF